MISRGIRNNNPGNIRRSSSRWLGIASYKTDLEFVQFESMDYGLRALMVLIRNYIKKGYNTPYKIIHRYAPKNENNTAAYLSFVYQYVPNNGVITPFSDDFYDLIRAICYYESDYYISVHSLQFIKKKFKL